MESDDAMANFRELLQSAGESAVEEGDVRIAGTMGKYQLDRLISSHSETGVRVYLARNDDGHLSGDRVGLLTVGGAELEDQDGDIVSLKELLKKGPVVLTFYRGKWCPHCNATLMRYQKYLVPALKQ